MVEFSDLKTEIEKSPVPNKLVTMQPPCLSLLDIDANLFFFLLYLRRGSHFKCTALTRPQSISDYSGEIPRPSPLVNKYILAAEKTGPFFL